MRHDLVDQRQADPSARLARRLGVASLRRGRRLVLQRKRRNDDREDRRHEGRSVQARLDQPDNPRMNPGPNFAPTYNLDC